VWKSGNGWENEDQQSAICLAFREIGGVVLDVEKHVPSMEANDGFGKESALVQKMRVLRVLRV
jgi:hypothetical protein